MFFFSLFTSEIFHSFAFIAPMINSLKICCPCAYMCVCLEKYLSFEFYKFLPSCCCRVRCSVLCTPSSVAGSGCVLHRLSSSAVRVRAIWVVRRRVFVYLWCEGISAYVTFYGCAYTCGESIICTYHTIITHHFWGAPAFHSFFFILATDQRILATTFHSVCSRCNTFTFATRFMKSKGTKAKPLIYLCSVAGSVCTLGPSARIRLTSWATWRRSTPSTRCLPSATLLTTFSTYGLLACCLVMKNVILYASVFYSFRPKERKCLWDGYASHFRNSFP